MKRDLKNFHNTLRALQNAMEATASLTTANQWTAASGIPSLNAAGSVSNQVESSSSGNSNDLLTQLHKMLNSRANSTSGGNGIYSLARLVSASKNDGGSLSALWYDSERD